MSLLLPEVASRKLPRSSRVTCLSLHPTEPLLLVGLSSGDLCVYVSRTDGVTALLKAHGGQSSLSAATGQAGASAPPDPAKVLRVDATGFALRHCLFLGGREDDLVADVVQPLAAPNTKKGGAATAGVSSSSSSSAASLNTMARHLVLCITETNSVYLLDIDSNALLLHWDCNRGAAERKGGLAPTSSVSSASSGIHRDSPFAPHRVIVHAVGYGALLFLTVTDRTSAASAAAREVMLPPMQTEATEKKVFVCHLTETNPFLAPTPTPRLQQRQQDQRSNTAKAAGPFVISLRSHYKTAKHVLEKKLLKKQTSIRFLRVHPFAPILLVGTAQCVFVFTNFSESGERLPPHAIIAPREALRATASRRGSNDAHNSGSGGDAVIMPDVTEVVDACFLPTSVVLHGGSDGAGVQNLQLALLTCHRASILDLSHASAEGVLDEQAFSTPITLVRRHRRGQKRPHPVFFSSLYTWVGSPGTVFVAQNDGTALEFSRNGTMGPLTRVLMVRSRLLHETRIAAVSTQIGATSAAIVKGPQLSQCRLMMEMSSIVPRVSSTLPLWGVLDSFPADPRTLCANPSLNASGERRVVFSRPTGRSALYTAVAGLADGGDAAQDGRNGEPATDTLVVESLMAATDTVDCSAVAFTAILSSASAPAGDSSLLGNHPCGLPIGSLLLELPVRLLRMEHGYYFIGGRAQATEVFVVAGLLFSVDGTDLDDAGSGGGGGECPRPALRAALLCLPASEAKARASSGSLRGASAARGGATPAHITHLPSPSLPRNDSSDSSARSPVELLSVSFQLSNDETTPCVWALWASPPSSSSSASAPAPSNPVTLLTFHSYFVSAEAAELVWHNMGVPEVVQIADPVYQHPSQVFALTAIGGPRGTWPLEAPTVGQLFLYYEESQVLMLGSVVRGSPFVVATEYSMGVDGGTRRDNTLRFCPQATLHIAPWARGWSSPAKGPGRRFNSAIQLTATLSTEGNALLVAAASRRHGFAVMQFPVLGRPPGLAATATAPLAMQAPTEEAMMAAVLGRAGARSAGVAALSRGKLLFTRRWSQTDAVRAVDPNEAAGIPASDDEGDDNDLWESDSSTSSASSQTEAAGDAARNARPAVHIRVEVKKRTKGEAAVRAVSAKMVSQYAPVNLLEWMFLAPSNGAHHHHQHAQNASSRGSWSSPIASSLARQRQQWQSEAALLASFETGVVPFLVLQRHRKLYVVQMNGGTVVPLCPAIASSIPIGVAYKLVHTRPHEGGDGGSDLATTRRPRSAHESAAGKDGDEDSSGSGSRTSGHLQGEDETDHGTGRDGLQQRGNRQGAGPGTTGREQNLPNNSSSSTGARGDDPTALRVHLVYGDYLGALAQTFRERQTQEQHAFFEAGNALAVQQARTNTAASPFWLFGANKLKKSHPISAREAADPGGLSPSRKVIVGTPGAGKADELAAARARLMGSQKMQSRMQQVREGHRPSLSSATTTRESDARHGTVFHMDVTETLSAAVLKMQGMIISQAITDLVASSVLFSQFIRDTFDAFTRHVQTAVVFGNVQAAEILVAVPLASVTYCVSHEVRLLVTQQRDVFARWASGTARTNSGGGGGQRHNGIPSMTDLLLAQRTRRQWWMLVMRSYSVVATLNPAEREESWMAVQQMLQVAPEPMYPIPRNMPGSGSAEYSCEAIAELLLYCPASEHPSHLWASGTATSTSGSAEAFWEAEAPCVGGGGTPCGGDLFIQALFHALGLLGASPGILAKKEKQLATRSPAQRTRADYAAALTDVVKSIPVDAKHWLSAVLFCRLVGNLKEIGEGGGGGGGSEGRSTHSSRHSHPVGPEPDATAGGFGSCAALARLFAHELETEGNQLSAMTCVVEVAESTVAALKGVPFRPRGNGSSHRDGGDGEGGEEAGGQRDEPGRASDNPDDDENGTDMQSTSLSTVTGGAQQRVTEDELRKRRMQAAVAQSMSTRIQVLGDDYMADGMSSHEEAQAAMAWQQLEENGLAPITASSLKRSADESKERQEAQQQLRDAHDRQKQREAAQQKAAVAARDGDVGEVEQVAQREEYFEKGVGLLARLDQLRAEVYARHWRALYNTAAYPSRFSFSHHVGGTSRHSSSGGTAGGRRGQTINGYPLSQLPPQAWPASAASTTSPSATSAQQPSRSQQQPQPQQASAAIATPPPRPSDSLQHQPQPQSEQPVTVSRRVTPLEDQMAAVMEAYTFQSVASRQLRGPDSSTSPAGNRESAAVVAGPQGEGEGPASARPGLPDVRFGGESVVSRQRQQQQPSQPRRSLDDGNYKSRFASEEADEGPSLL